VYENTGRHQEALEEFKKAIHINKDAYSVYENMSRTCKALHDSVNAAEYANAALLARDRLPKPMLGEGQFPTAPVTRLIIATIICFAAILYFQVKKSSV
jgi:tetratricopeptide (TPR) repeat protein